MDDNQVLQQSENQLIPFYELFLNKLPVPYYISTLILMIPLLLIYVIVGRMNGVDVFLDYSWMLSVMIGAILILVMRATIRLREFFLCAHDVFNIDRKNMELFNIVKTALSHQTMLLYGLFFGIANSFLGIYYGIWYQEPILIFMLLLQIFVVGGVCGFAISGIYGVLKVIFCAVRISNYELDTYSTDKCGGMSRIGGFLLEFAAVSLLAGLLIAFYIYNSPWSHLDWGFVIYFIYFWMAFPHLAAILVVSIPLLQLHNVLVEKKSIVLGKLSTQRRDLRDELLAVSDNLDRDFYGRFTILRTKYQILNEVVEEVETVKEWPINVNSGFSFSITYVITLVVPLMELWNSISGLLN